MRSNKFVAPGDRFRGALLGLACGDAVGTTVEFRPRKSFAPVVDMVGGGPFNLKPGQWTDDTSMALCLAESLLYRNEFDAVDQMNRYCNWWQHGYLSSTGDCFDIGNATQAALRRYLETRDPFSGSTSPSSGGNGSLMRLAPVVLFFSRLPEECLHYAEASSRTTHAAPEPVECCRVMAQLLLAILQGVARDDLLSHAGEGIREPAVRNLIARNHGAISEEEVRGTGYCIDSLGAALWAFLSTDNFESAILRAVNLGDDADTTAAICGQFAGAYYGVESIPSAWRTRLAMADYIDDVARRLYDAAQRYAHKVRVAQFPAAIREAHTHSADHRREIEASELCGCFHCYAIFKPTEIMDWIDKNDAGLGQTALCARCGIDSVIGSRSGFPITSQFLQEMKRHWF